MITTTKPQAKQQALTHNPMWRQIVYILWYSDSRLFEMSCAFLGIALAGSILYFNYLHNDANITQGKVISLLFVIDALLRARVIIVQPNTEKHIMSRRVASLISVFLWLFLTIEVAGGSTRYGYPQTIGIYVAGFIMNTFMYFRLHRKSLS